MILNAVVGAATSVFNFFRRSALDLPKGFSCYFWSDIAAKISFFYELASSSEFCFFFFTNLVNITTEMFPLIVESRALIGSHFLQTPLVTPLPKFLDSCWRGMYLSLYRRVYDWMRLQVSVHAAHALGSGTRSPQNVIADSCRRRTFCRSLELLSRAPAARAVLCSARLRYALTPFAHSSRGWVTIWPH